MFGGYFYCVLYRRFHCIIIWEYKACPLLGGYFYCVLYRRFHCIIIWYIEPCPLLGGYFYCVLYRSVLYRRFHCIIIWDSKACPLLGGYFYCVLYSECPLSEVPPLQVGHNMTIKIANFGLSYDRRSEEYCSIKSHKSTPVPLRWLAPESICHNKISVYSDIWSFGVLLWEIFSFGARPYSDLSNAEVVRDVLSGRVLSCPDRCPQDIYDLMMKCWNLSPSKRPWFSSILSELIQVPKRMGSKGMKSFGGAPPTPELVRALRTSMSSSEKQ